MLHTEAVQYSELSRSWYVLPPRVVRELSNVSYLHEDEIRITAQYKVIWADFTLCYGTIGNCDLSQ